jgi:putative DNA primase/helicase
VGTSVKEDRDEREREEELLGKGEFDKRPTVRLVAGELHKTVEEVEQNLLLMDSGLYKHGPRVMRAVLDEIRTFDGKTGRTLRLSRVTAPHLTERIAAAVYFEKWDKREKGPDDKRGKWVKCNCPPNIADVYLARDGDWKLRAIQAVVAIPTFRPDGSLIDKPGYDVGTGLLYDPMGVEFPPIPDKPTKAQALAALAVLKEPLAKFEFTTAASKSVVIAGMMTAAIRRSVDTAP